MRWDWVEDSRPPEVDDVSYRSYLLFPRRKTLSLHIWMFQLRFFGRPLAQKIRDVLCKFL